MKRAFVVSDIHGMYDHFCKLLTYWNREDKLVILGDMIDRGIESLKVVQLVKELSSKYDVSLLMGNHDEMLIQYIDKPTNYERYFRNGAETTILSFTQNMNIHQLPHEERAKQLMEACPNEIEFMRTAKLYEFFGKVFFTHAGFWSWRDCWEETSDEQFVWIRNHYKVPNNSGFINVFGHTPTRYIHLSESNDIWVSEDKMYIGIDGACVYGGQLNGILIDEKGTIVETYFVKEVDIC